jgi:hypothetical protein
MKKSNCKLVLRSETIRALRVLDNRDLARAVGGDAVPQVESTESGRICPAQVESGESGRICPAPVVVTAACG